MKGHQKRDGYILAWKEETTSETTRMSRRKKEKEKLEIGEKKTQF